MAYGSQIAALLREGAIALLHDYRSGSALDQVPGGTNHGVLSSGARFLGPASALTFPATTDEVTVADAASLRLTAGSIIAVSERGFTSQVNYETLAHKWGANIGYQLYLGAGIVIFRGDATIRTITTNILGKRSVGVAFTSGGTPIGYADGLSLGNFSGTVTVTTGAADAQVGNISNSQRCQSPLSAVLLANRILTPTEMAACHAELLAARWPSKQYSIGKRVQGSVIGEANLLAGYTLRPSGLSVPSHNGAYTGTVSGQAQHVNSILGDALSLGRTTGAVDLGVGNAQIDPTTDSHWVEVWARPLDVAMSDASAPIIGKGVIGAYSHYGNFGIEHQANNYYLYWLNATPAYVFVGGPAPRNKLTHLLYQVDRVTNNAYLYVDGVQYGPTAIGADLLAAQATNWIVGKNGSTTAAFDESFGGLVCNPRIGTGVLTPAQVQSRYLEGARAVQFKTDYGYSISPADEGGVTGQQIGGGSSPFRAGDAVGRWRIETDTIDGRTCKVLTCKTTGVVYVPASYFHAATPTEAAFGTWDWWVYDSGLLSKVKFIATANAGASDAPPGYYLQHAVDNSVAVLEAGVGYVVSGGTATHNAWHHYRVTRSLSGLFTAYIDGVAFGTGADTTTTAGYYITLYSGAGFKIALGDTVGDHCIAKMLGVVAP